MHNKSQKGRPPRKLDNSTGEGNIATNSMVDFMVFLTGNTFWIVLRSHLGNTINFPPHSSRESRFTGRWTFGRIQAIAAWHTWARRGSGF